MRRRTSVIILASTAAAIGGIAAVYAVVRLSETRTKNVDDNRSRDIKDVIADCYSKLSEIEANLPEND